MFSLIRMLKIEWLLVLSTCLASFLSEIQLLLTPQCFAGVTAIPIAPCRARLENKLNEI